jgi:protein-tyrosine phosphatase
MEGAARQVRVSDFNEFDLLLAMDRENLAELRELAPDAEAEAKVHMLREYDPASAGAPDLDVPDPYYGGPQGFETVLDQVEAACRGLLATLR